LGYWEQPKSEVLFFGAKSLQHFTTMKVDPNDKLFQLCSYMVKAANAFFRTIREHGIFLVGDICTIARTYGHEMNAAWHHMFGANPRKTIQVSLRTHV
jgi:hypothetical protein